MFTPRIWRRMAIRFAYLSIWYHYCHKFYYTFASTTSNHNYEIDFLLSRGNKVCPLEVKSSGYATHASIDNFCEKFSARISDKYLIYTKDFGKDKGVVCLPIFMVPFLWCRQFVCPFTTLLTILLLIREEDIPSKISRNMGCEGFLR